MKGYVYILTNKKRNALYTGVTRNLKERMQNHINHKYPRSFTARYNITRLVYYESYESMASAIKREKQIKGGSRQEKLDLINKVNPEWNDLLEFLDN